MARNFGLSRAYGIEIIISLILIILGFAAYLRPESAALFNGFGVISILILIYGIYLLLQPWSNPRKVPGFVMVTLILTINSLLYLAPTFHSAKLKDKLDLEVDSLAQFTQTSKAELSKAVTEGRNDYVLDQVIAMPDSALVKRNLAKKKADYIFHELNEKIEFFRKNSLKLGLDLQGGMHLVLEVDLVQLMNQLAQSKDAQFDSLLAEISHQLRTDPKADFQKTVEEVFRQHNASLPHYFPEKGNSDPQVIKALNQDADDAIVRTLEILRNRIDQFGVSEPTIVQQGSRRILVELPGVQDPARARSLIGQTALLEFKLLTDPGKAQKILDDIDRYLRHEKGRVKADSLTHPDSLAALASLEAAKPEPVKTDSSKADTSKADSTAPKIAQDKVIDAAKLFTEEGEHAQLGEDTSLVVDQGLESERPFTALLRNIGDEIAVLKQNRRAVELILAKPEVRALIPPEAEFVWGNALITGPDKKQYWNLYMMKAEPEITGQYITKADVTVGTGGSNPGREGEPIVSLAFNSEGRGKFAKITNDNLHKKLGIVLDKHVYMAPVIQAKIPDGRAIIEGSESMEEARQLAIVLRAGALKAPVQIIEEQTVGPSLGADSISKGKLAAILSFLLVTLFMIWYYKFAGLIADLALVLNMVFMLAALAGIHATLTMPGIAGIILTIGMAVDANVLIYERIREELRLGKTVRSAIEAGYHRAIVTIMDAQITTIIAGVVLYQFGTGSIRGFALTLIIGIVVSLYTSIVSSRLLFEIYTQKFSPTKLSI